MGSPAGAWRRTHRAQPQPQSVPHDQHSHRHRHQHSRSRQHQHSRKHSHQHPTPISRLRPAGAAAPAVIPLVWGWTASVWGSTARVLVRSIDTRVDAANSCRISYQACHLHSPPPVRSQSCAHPHTVVGGRRVTPRSPWRLALAPAWHAPQAADASTWGKFAAPFILNLGSAPRHARIAALEPRLVRKS